jgi:hypothetical protein
MSGPPRGPLYLFSAILAAMTRLLKQLIFGGIYLAIIAAVLYGGYRLFVPAANCSDGIQNGREEGVDCGALACGKLCAAPVKALEAKPVELIENSDGSWDALVHLENPNGAYGASRVDYMLTVSDASGTVLATRRGNTYVNPVQPRYLVFPFGKLATAPAKAELQFDPAAVEWAALSVDAAGSVEFAVRGDTLAPTDGTLRYEATVTNHSRFDFNEVDATVLLYDASGKVVGAGSTVVRTLLANETRGFIVDWPFAVPGAVRNQAFVGTNIFSNANYIREYGSPQEF